MDARTETTQYADPDFFSGVTMEIEGIAERASSICVKALALDKDIAVAASQRSVALLKSAIAMNDTIGREIQQDVDRMRGLIAHLDRKLAAHQSRKPRS